MDGFGAWGAGGNAINFAFSCEGVIVMVLAGLGEEEDSYNVEIVASREDKMNVYQDRTLWLGRGWGPYLVLVQAMHTMLSAAAASLL